MAKSFTDVVMLFFKIPIGDVIWKATYLPGGVLWRTLRGSYNSKLAVRIGVGFCTGWANTVSWYIGYIGQDTLYVVFHSPCGKYFTHGSIMLLNISKWQKFEPPSIILSNTLNILLPINSWSPRRSYTLWKCKTAPSQQRASVLWYHSELLDEQLRKEASWEGRGHKIWGGGALVERSKREFNI